MEWSPTGTHKRSRQPHLVQSLQEKEVKGAASIHQYSIDLDILYDGADYQRVPPRLWDKFRVVATVDGDGDLEPSKVLGGGGSDCQDLSGCEFLLPLGFIRVRSTKNIVDLLVRLGEVMLGILGLLLTIGRFSRLENLICKTLESVTISGLVLSLWVKNTNVIQEAFEFTRPGPVLLMTVRPFNRVNRTARLSLLVVALG
jgi:hypothetical protein